MAAELNRKLPPQKRMSLIRLREHIFDIKRLHGEYFPNSRLRVSALVLINVSAMLVVAGVIAGFMATSEHL